MAINEWGQNRPVVAFYFFEWEDVMSQRILATIRTTYRRTIFPKPSLPRGCSIKSVGAVPTDTNLSWALHRLKNGVGTRSVQTARHKDSTSLECVVVVTAVAIMMAVATVVMALSTYSSRSSSAVVVVVVVVAAAAADCARKAHTAEVMLPVTTVVVTVVVASNARFGVSMMVWKADMLLSNKPKEHSGSPAPHHMKMMETIRMMMMIMQK